MYHIYQEMLMTCLLIMTFVALVASVVAIISSHLKTSVVAIAIVFLCLAMYIMIRPSIRPVMFPEISKNNETTTIAEDSLQLLKSLDEYLYTVANQVFNAREKGEDDAALVQILTKADDLRRDLILYLDSRGVRHNFPLDHPMVRKKADGFMGKDEYEILPGATKIKAASQD